ncbi:MAG: GNAT family N-acetyltransferase [Clostridia bacterium]|nr:GNAT family N-acetyltransferase [Clostridia bacterium]
MELNTERLRIIPLTPEQIELLIMDIPKLERELGFIYRGEAIEGHLLEITRDQYAAACLNRENFLWHTFWQFVLKDENAVVGSACFKGCPTAHGDVEIGYGTNELYQNRGYTTEAIAALCKWGLEQNGVKRIIAETEKDNIPSHRVLQKCNMKIYRETEECYWWSLSISE